MVKEAAGPLKEALSAKVRELGIKGLIWAQYTPYFNDGDECVFSVHSVNLITGDPAEAEYYGDGCCEMWSDWEDTQKYYAEELAAAGVTKEQYEAARDLAGKLESAAYEDVLRQAFGDHVVVKVTADGVEVDHYDHD